MDWVTVRSMLTWKHSKAVLDGGPNTFHHRLEHNTLLRDDMFARFGEIDAVTVIFGYYTGMLLLGGKRPIFIFDTGRILRKWNGLTEN